MGVILSGMGSDGTLGLRAIKESGGLVLVQDPATAKFDSMPRSASTLGMADRTLPPEKIADEAGGTRYRASMQGLVFAPQ